MKILVTIVLVYLLPIVSLDAQTIHAIFYVTDEKRQGIYASCQMDRRLMTSEVEKVQRLTNLKAKFYDTDFTKKSLEGIISSIKVGRQDVIMFYYSGHGFNIGNSNYPCMNFRESSSSLPHVSLYQTHKRLKEKGARFVLTIGDLCNNLAKSKYSQLLTGKERSIGYTKLFMQYRGDIIVTSSKKSQYSGVEIDGSGSYFTLSFLDAIRSCVNNGDYYWSKILKQAKLKTTQRDSGSKQEPYYDINVELIQQGNTFED